MVIQSILNYFKYEVITKEYSVQLMNELFERNKENVSFSEMKIAYEALKSHIFSILTYRNATIKKNSSTLIDEMLIWCRFGGVECFSSDFEWLFHPYFGNCYIFNSGKDSNGEQVPIRISYKAAQYDAL